MAEVALVKGSAALGEEYGYCFRPDNTEDASTERAPSKWAQLKTAKALLPEIGRFHACNDAAMKYSRLVGIHVKGEAAWFRGVMRCGSVWICPVCARQVSEGRKEDLQAAIDNAVRQEKGVILVTLTFPHGVGDVLADILEKFTKAQRQLKSGRSSQRRRKLYGFLGEIKTLEVTHGANGWHPHAHSLWILKKPLSEKRAAALRARLYQDWLHACRKVKLPDPSPEHGVDVRGARYAAAYVAKWGFAMELAGGTSKRGKKESGGRTPWQLLAAAAAGDQRAALLWREFALAFFGKRQLFWSRGLRDALKLAPELTDQQEMELQDARAKQVIVLDLDTWYCVRKAGAQEAVLHHAVNDMPGLYALLNYLRSTVPMENGPPPGPREDWEG